MSKVRLWFKEQNLIAVAIAWVALIYLIFLFSNYFYYGAEGIYVNGLVRLFNGLPYISGFDQTPITLSTYFPSAYIFYYPFGKILQLESPQAVVYLVRILSPIYYMGYLFVLMKLITRCSQVVWNQKFVQLCLLLFISKEFSIFLSFKPDTHALFFELIGFVLALIYIRENHMKLIIVSAVFFAGAALLKLNMIGLGIGVAISLLFNKRFYALLAFTFTGLLTLAVGSLIIYSWMGGSLFSALMETTGSDILSIKKIPVILNRTFFQILIPYLVILYVVHDSITKKNIWSAQQKVLVISSVSVSFGLALVGQFKYGADRNYFYEFILVSIFLSGFGFSSLKSLKQHITAQKLMIGLVVFMMSLLLVLPIQIVSNDLKNYDFVGMNQFIDKTFSEPKVFTENNNVAVHLGHRAQTATGFFAFINATRSIEKRIPEFMELLSRGEGLNAFVVATSNCENYKPDKRFEPIIGQFNKIIYKKDKICIFGKNLD